MAGTVIGVVFGYGLAALVNGDGPALLSLLLLCMFGIFYTPPHSPPHTCRAPNWRRTCRASTSATSSPSRTYCLIRSPGLPWAESHAPRYP
ncbi:hypothetical protein [Streptomyces sp. NPDC004830]